MITSSAVKSITSRARPIVNKLLMKVSSHISHKDIGKVYFRTTYPGEWDAACESAQPLLRLCSGHWKAEFVLAQVIKSTKRGKRGGPVMTASRSPSPELDTALPEVLTPITAIESPHNDLIPKKRKVVDRSPSPLPIFGSDMDISPTTKKSRKGKEVEKPSGTKATKAASSKKKPRSEYILKHLFDYPHNFSLHQCYIRFRYWHSQSRTRTICGNFNWSSSHHGNFRPSAHRGNLRSSACCVNFRPSACCVNFRSSACHVNFRSSACRINFRPSAHWCFSNFWNINYAPYSCSSYL